MRLLILLLLTLSNVSPYKILVYNSKFGYSNINFYGVIADILVEAGHDVTTLLPEIDPSWDDGTTKSKKIRVPQTAETKILTDILNSEIVDWFAMEPLDFIGTFFTFDWTLKAKPSADRFVLQCEGTLADTALITHLKAEKFDVMIAENFDMCGIGLSHVIQPKALINGAASVPIAWMTQEFGLPFATSYNPSPLIPGMNVHSVWDRLKNLYAHAIFYKIFYSSRSLIETLFKDKFGPNFPSLTEISSHAAYTLIYSEPLADVATPTLSRIVHIGGIGARQPQALTEEFETLLALRNRTALISFGSVTSTHRIPENVKMSIAKTISNFPDFTFIWKYEQPEDDFAKAAKSMANNLYLFKWVPQSDLLADPRLTAFITHAGMGSTQETILRGKPGLFIPLFADQPRNAAVMELNGLGRVFDKHDLSDATKFTAAVDDLLHNEKYYQNSKRLSSMVAKKPFSAREVLIKTVEFAAEFGPSPALRPQSYGMTFIAYHNIDIIILILSVLVLIIFITIKCLASLAKKCLTPKVKSD